MGKLAEMMRSRAGSVSDSCSEHTDENIILTCRQTFKPTKGFPYESHPFKPKDPAQDIQRIISRLNGLKEKRRISNRKLARLIDEKNDHDKIKRWLNNPALIPRVNAERLAVALGTTVSFIRDGFVDTGLEIKTAPTKDLSHRLSPETLKEYYEYLDMEDQELVTSLVCRLVVASRYEIDDMRERLFEFEEEKREYERMDFESNEWQQRRSR